MQHFALAEAEYNETCGKQVVCGPKDTLGAAGYILRNDKLSRVSCCGLVDFEAGETCEYHSNVGYNSEAREGRGGVKLVNFAPHTCGYQCEIQPRHASTAYTTDNLVKIVTPHILKNETFGPANVKTVLFPTYLKLEPPVSLCKSVLKEARRMAVGEAQEMVRRLPAYAEALRQKGHRVTVRWAVGVRARVCVRAMPVLVLGVCSFATNEACIHTDFGCVHCRNTTRTITR